MQYVKFTTSLKIKNKSILIKILVTTLSYPFAMSILILVNFVLFIIFKILLNRL